VKDLEGASVAELGQLGKQLQKGRGTDDILQGLEGRRGSFQVCHLHSRWGIRHRAMVTLIEFLATGP
jgi:hypothetical protein